MSTLVRVAARPLSAVAAAVLLSACQGPASTGSATPGNDVGAGAAAGAAMGLSLPARLQDRAVDRTRLRPDVTLSTGQTIAMRLIGGTTWSGTVQVAPDIDLGVRVVWVSEQPRGDLRLAQLDETVPIGPDGAALEVGGARYDFDFDDDGDGESNLDELIAGSDPFPEVPVPPVDPTPTTPDPDSPEPDAPEPGTPGTPGTDEPGPGAPPPGDDDDDDDDDDAEEPDTGAGRPADVDVFVPRIASARAPEIDGRGVTMGNDGTLTGEWAGAIQVDSGGSPLGIDALMIDLGAEAPSGTPWRSWGALHDGEYLYVVVVVEDDGQRLADSTRYWENDSIELFLDGNHSRLSEYGDADDHHLILPLLEPGTTAGQKRPNANDIGGWQTGPASTGQGLQLDFVTGPGVGPDGLQRPRFERDVYEMRIALDSIGVRAGQPFGFELQVNDDDDGGTRDSKWGWAHPARVDVDVDFTYLDPSFMGTMMLD